jgi:hypothetical protein
MSGRAITPRVTTTKLPPQTNAIVRIPIDPTVIPKTVIEKGSEATLIKLTRLMNVIMFCGSNQV